MPSSQKNQKNLGKRFWNTRKYRRQGNPKKDVKCGRGPISMATIIKKPDEANNNQTDFSDIDQVADILKIGTQLRWVINSIYCNTKNAILTVYANYIAH
jgi:hypothetical protein